MRKIIVIGGGAAGMMSAYAASLNGNHVVLLEKNEKLGKKLYITGKGRCNVTTAVDKQEFLRGVVSNSKFLFSAVNAFSSQDLIDLLQSNGLKLKTERGDRVFPESDKASDVTKTLEKMLKHNGVEVKFGVEVQGVSVQNGIVNGVDTNCGFMACDSVVVCCGGISYPLTGSTGDGYNFAKRLGHTIVEPRPALVGIELLGNDFLELQGLSLKNVSLSAMLNGKNIYSDFGEMLFTHFGVSGPIVLSCSSIINRKDLKNIRLSIDLKPALTQDVLNERLIREFKENNVKNLSTAMRSLLPKALIDVVLRQAGVRGQKNCSEITTEERFRIVSVLKNLAFSVKKLRPVEEAIVTAGGVSVSEVNPKTMESKIISGLYFAGEVLDLDAYTGGYNLQIAWSTGFVAGNNC